LLNKVTLLGSLGKDPETRFFPSGDQQTTVSIATSRRWKDKTTGERKEKTAWHNLVFNGPLAKIAGEYLKKGSKIHVTGEIEYQEWETDGVKKYATKIIVNDLIMLDSKPEGQQSREPRREPGKPGTMESENKYDDYDDDLPF